MAERNARTSTLHSDDAFSFLVACLRRKPDGYGPEYGHDVWLPRVVGEFLRGEGKQPSGGEHLDPNLDGLWRAFYDAAWRLCRMGVLRPSLPFPRAASSSTVPPGSGFCITVAGREWLTRTEPGYFPSDPGRYTQAMDRAAHLLGAGFRQRANEAARCHETACYLACCAMCGAAAESALLAVAIKKTNDEALVLRGYVARDGRRRVVELIFEGKQSPLRARFETAFNLLTYWRDEAAHGQPSSISELEAYDALGRLLRLATFLSDVWTTLTTP